MSKRMGTQRHPRIPDVQSPSMQMYLLPKQTSSFTAWHATWEFFTSQWRWENEMLKQPDQTQIAIY